MFGFFASQEKKMRDHATNWVELAEKIYHFRRDVLTKDQLSKLVQQTAALKAALKQRAETAKLKLVIEETEAVLRETGGAIYPRGSLVENIEFFVVAAIVILGIRTYFVQPFKIPTNSMWPTYYGMKGENLPPGANTPNVLEKAFRLAAFGAQRKEVIAPKDGEVKADFFSQTGQMAYRVVEGRSWFVFPAKLKEYTFYVDSAPVTLRVPLDFHDFDRLVRETFFGDEAKFAANFMTLAMAPDAESGMIKMTEETNGLRPVRRIKLGKTVRTGDVVLRFDLLTGDQLLVDRMSYHFMRPRVGSGFVFRTVNIPGIGEDQYYIKRLVGVPGDVLEVKEPFLYRNGQPITGSAAFGLNATRSGLYRGYVNGGNYLAKNDTLTVPANRFFAMGDNSKDSADGRYWGFVPDKDVVGRPILIYYPFTKRWGPAK